MYNLFWQVVCCVKGIALFEWLQNAAAINVWRFSKLKEYKEENIEVENEAFDRYMQNVDLL